MNKQVYFNEFEKRLFKILINTTLFQEEQSFEKIITMIFEKELKGLKTEIEDKKIKIYLANSFVRKEKKNLKFKHKIKFFLGRNNSQLIGYCKYRARLKIENLVRFFKKLDEYEYVKFSKRKNQITVLPNEIRDKDKNQYEFHIMIEDGKIYSELIHYESCNFLVLEKAFELYEDRFMQKEDYKFMKNLKVTQKALVVSIFASVFSSYCSYWTAKNVETVVVVKQYYINRDGVRLRSSPSAQSTELSKLAEGQIIKVLKNDKQKKYIYIIYSHKGKVYRGWIKSEFVSCVCE